MITNFEGFIGIFNRGRTKLVPGIECTIVKCGDLTWCTRRGDFLVSGMSKRKRKISSISTGKRKAKKAKKHSIPKKKSKSCKKSRRKCKKRKVTGFLSFAAHGVIGE